MLESNKYLFSAGKVPVGDDEIEEKKPNFEDKFGQVLLKKYFIESFNLAANKL